MSVSNKATDVHRLSDMIVEEVSLVDRAANKQQFLIVKRSDEMTDTTENSSGATTTSTEVGNEPLGNDTTLENVQDEDDSAEVTGGKIQQVAVSALSHLTDAVEMLADSDDETTRGRIVELAGELRSVAEQLAGTSETSNNTDAASNGNDKDLESLIGAIKASLESVTTLISGNNADATEAKLPELIGEMKSLTSAVKEQQQRLSKLEKRFGMPSSVAVGEEQIRGKGESDEVGWPMDMNRSCDRESVDKAVSFHDV